MKSFAYCLCLLALLNRISSRTKASHLNDKLEESEHRKKISNEKFNNLIFNYPKDNTELRTNDNSLIDYFTNDGTRSFSTEPNNGDILELRKILEKLLEQRGTWKAPLVIFEVSPQQFDDTSGVTKIDNVHGPKKRSRYYRRYPWKRRNSSSSYDYREEQYLCSPSRREVFKLLVALHGSRQGSLRPDVDFCKRHKPGGTVFTNIRFLGRRK